MWASAMQKGASCQQTPFRPCATGSDLVDTLQGLSLANPISRIACMPVAFVCDTDSVSVVGGAGAT